MNIVYYIQDAIRVPKLEDEEDIEENNNYITIWK